VANALSTPILITENLTRKYGSTFAVDKVNITLEDKGNITAILGQNGAGKTTFVHCAMGLTKPSSGRMRIFGHRPGNMAAKRRTGIMLQDADLPDQLTAREHLTLFSTYYPDPVPVNELLDECEISNFADKLYKNLSGGQKRRVQFAIAILGRPDLIFLDEPTTGLDIEARRVLWRIIRELTSSGTSVILTTHYLEEADALADRIVVMNEGKIIADAPTPEIRDMVGGAIIQCISGLSIAQIQSMPGVRSVQQSGRFVEIATLDAALTLRALLAADANISDLTVKKPSLEDAFLELTKKSTGDAA